MSAAESTPTPAALPVIDLSTALDAVGGDVALLREVLATLLGELPAELANLQRLAGAGDLHALAEQAHRLRGGAAYCGATALIAAIGALERSARHGDASAVGPALSQVAAESERLAQDQSLDAVPDQLQEQVQDRD